MSETPLEALDAALQDAKDTSSYRWPQQEDLPAILARVRDAVAVEIEAGAQRIKCSDLNNALSIARTARVLGLRQAASIARGGSR